MVMALFVSPGCVSLDAPLTPLELERGSMVTYLFEDLPQLVRPRGNA